MNRAVRKYALLIAADALQRDEWLVADLIADDGEDAKLTSAQVIDALRILAGEPQAHLAFIRGAGRDRPLRDLR